VFIKRTLPEETCQKLTPKQLNTVLMQWNLVIDAIEQFRVTRTQENSPYIDEQGEQVKPYENHIFRQLQAIQPLKGHPRGIKLMP